MSRDHRYILMDHGECKKSLRGCFFVLMLKASTAFWSIFQNNKVDRAGVSDGMFIEQEQDEFRSMPST